MANLPHKMPRKALFVHSICLLSLIPIIEGADPTFLSIECPNTTITRAPERLLANLIILPSLLSPNSKVSDGFYKFTVGGSPPDVAFNSTNSTVSNGIYRFTANGNSTVHNTIYGLAFCRGDLSAAECQDCVVYAAKDVVERCPGSKRVTIWYDECILRYSNVSIFSTLDTSFRLTLTNRTNVTNNATLFRGFLGEVLNDISARASSHESSRKFATGELNYTPLQPLYGLAQCTPDLSVADCNKCLRTCISIFPSCCDANIGARVLFPSCFVRYEMYLFYNASLGAAPLLPSPALPPPPSSTTTSSPGKGGVSSQVIIFVVLPIGVSILLFVVGFCFVTRRAKKKCNFVKEANGGDDISTVQSLQYDFGTIQAATNNFSDDNKIGEGGFGPVYKGLFPDGQEVAVKKLSRSSGQGALEFKNEVLLVAKLQHRNVVRLLGFCLEGEEKILIYEFVPNKSLDYFLFDQQEQILDWSRRYKIIGGIARGMLYLHEDSQLTIIHRDLKASNILLDGDMNAKISDFGMAQILRVDQTQGNASEMVGTLGYMSPEYAMHGQFSTLSDVFSFGVLILEIITGMKNNSFCQSDIAPDLLSYAWKFWNDGAPLHLMDPTQKAPYSKDEVIKCIHIALLCVQDNPCARPSMATVVAMLDGYFATLSLPQQPAFHGWSRTGLELDRSRSKPLEWSVNEVSISELEPR